MASKKMVEAMTRSLVPTKRKPFDVLTKRPSVLSSRPDCQSFEPNLEKYVEALLRPDPYVYQIERLMRRSA